MKLHCYHIPPIDFWFGAITPAQLLASIDGQTGNWSYVADLCKKLANLKTRAESTFKTIGWEGDVREGPFYFALPCENEMAIGYIVKQDNNGNCFIASPAALPHLDGLAFESVVEP